MQNIEINFVFEGIFGTSLWTLFYVSDRLEIFFLILIELISFCSPWNRQKTVSLLMISKEIELN